MDGPTSKRLQVILCFVAMVCCWGPVTGTPDPGEFTLRASLKQLRFSCNVSALPDDNVEQKPDTQTLRIWNMSESGERRGLAIMSTSESARVTGNLAGAVASGSWAAGTLTLTLTVSASQDVKGLGGSYGCSQYYYPSLKEHDPDDITISVSVTGDKRHYTASDPLGFDINAEFAYCLIYSKGKGGCCFKDSDVKLSATDVRDVIHDTSTGDGIITSVCPGTLSFNPHGHAATGTDVSMHKVVNPANAVYLQLDGSVAAGCVFSKNETETWICNALQPKENSEDETVSPGTVAIYVFISVLVLVSLLLSYIIIRNRRKLLEKCPISV